MNQALERPLLVATDTRVAVDGMTAIDRLTLTTQGDRVLVAGDACALFAALLGVVRSTGDENALPGEAEVVAGELLLAGRNVAERAHMAAMGAAPLDPPLPADWTGEAYVTWSARLSGEPSRTARALAAATLNRMGLEAMQRKKLGAAALPERRALVLAQAIVLAPEVLVAEAPLAGLEGAAAAFVMRALQVATDGRRALLSAARLDAESPEGTLARGASHLVVLAGGEVAVEGRPADLFTAAKVVTLAVRSNVEALRVELAARGIALRGGPTRFSTTLPAGVEHREILRSAAVARAAITEMTPVLG